MYFYREPGRDQNERGGWSFEMVSDPTETRRVLDALSG
jgi:hypothetical protein